MRTRYTLWNWQWSNLIRRSVFEQGPSLSDIHGWPRPLFIMLMVMSFYSPWGSSRFLLSCMMVFSVVLIMIIKCTPFCYHNDHYLRRLLIVMIIISFNNHANNHIFLLIMIIINSFIHNADHHMFYLSWWSSLLLFIMLINLHVFAHHENHHGF